MTLSSDLDHCAWTLVASLHRDDSTRRTVSCSQTLFLQSDARTAALITNPKSFRFCRRLMSGALVKIWLITKLSSLLYTSMSLHGGLEASSTLPALSKCIQSTQCTSCYSMLEVPRVFTTDMQSRLAFT